MRPASSSSKRRFMIGSYDLLSWSTDEKEVYWHSSFVFTNQSDGIFLGLSWLGRQGQEMTSKMYAAFDGYSWWRFCPTRFHLVQSAFAWKKSSKIKMFRIILINQLAGVYSNLSIYLSILICSHLSIYLSIL